MSHKNISNDHSIKSCLAASALCLFSILIIYGASGLIPGAGKIFVQGDALVQVVPMIKMFLRRLLSGESLVYSFESGMGMPTVASYAYLCLSPFNIFFLIIDDINTAYFVTFSAKVVASAVAMALLLDKTYTLKHFTCAVFSCMYALNAFVINFDFGLVFFDMLVILPLIILGLRHFIATGRWHILCVLYAVAFCVNFYSAYMMGIFSFIVYLSLAGVSFGRDFKLWKSSVLKYILCVLIAVLMAMPVLLPTAVELFSRLVSDRNTLDSLVLTPADFLSALYPGVVKNAYNVRPMLYCGLLPFFYTVLYFAWGNKSRSRKILQAFPLFYLIMCCFIKPLYLMMHAFDAPDGYCFRFSWMISFWLIFMAPEAIDEMDYIITVKKKGVYITAFVMSILCFVFKLFPQLLSDGVRGELSLSVCTISCVFVVSYCILIRFGNDKNIFGTVLMFVSLMEMVGNNVLSTASYDGWDDMRYYNIWQDQADGALAVINDEEETDNTPFYRIYYLNGLNDNISMLKGYNGMGWFLNIENEKLRNLLHYMGYATSTKLLRDYGSTEPMRMLLSQKYSVKCASVNSDNVGQYSVQKNRITLPPAYMVSEDILAWKADDSDPFISQNTLASAFCGRPVAFWEETDGSYYVKTDGVELEMYEEGILIKTIKGAPEAKVVITVPYGGEKAMYAYIPRRTSVSIPGTPLMISAADIGGVSNRPYLYMPRILPLAMNGNDEWEFSICMQEEYDAADFRTVYFAYPEEKGMDECYEELINGGVEFSYCADGEWKGKVKVEAGKTTLFTSIPWGDGWELYVDGKKTELIPLLEGAFIGAVLETGEHELHFVYHNKWILPGIISGICGWAVYFMTYLIYRKRFFENMHETVKTSHKQA